MIIDTSAVIAMLKPEPDAQLYASAIAVVPEHDRMMSAGTYQECGAVMSQGRDPAMSRKLDELMKAARITILPVTEQRADLARRAYWDFGRGSGHPARLNFGDCFAYALALDLDHPLLWKGDDFAHTGIRSALQL